MFTQNIMKKTNGQRGFSLIEIMVVLAIISIVSAISVPAYFSWKPKHDLNRAVREYHNLLYKAKASAIKDRGSCQVSFTATSYTIVCDDRDPSICQGTNSCTFVKTIVPATEYSNFIVFQDPTGNPAFPLGNVTFNAMGESNQGYLYFTNTQGNDFYRVGPLISGVINLHHWTGATWE